MLKSQQLEEFKFQGHENVEYERFMSRKKHLHGLNVVISEIKKVVVCAICDISSK